MSYTLANINGSTVPTNGQTIALKNGGNAGAVVVYNNSLVALLVDDTQSNTYFLPPGWADRYLINEGTSFIRLSPTYTLPVGFSPDLVSFVVESVFDVKRDTRTYPQALGANLGTSSALVTGITLVPTLLDASTGVNAGIMQYSPTPGLLFKTPQAGVAQGVAFGVWNGSANTVPFAIALDFGGISGMVLTNGGGVSKFRGQATAGNYGMPMVLASANVSVLNNSQTTIVSATVPNIGANQVIMALASFGIGNGNTNTGTITLNLSYTDAFTGVVQNYKFTLAGTTYQFLNALAGIGKNTGWQCIPLAVYAQPNTTIAVQYTNAAAGTIADSVTATLIPIA